MNKPKVSKNLFTPIKTPKVSENLFTPIQTPKVSENLAYLPALQPPVEREEETK